MNSNGITFPCQFVRVKTTVDGGWEITVATDNRATRDVCTLALMQGVILQAAFIQAPDQDDESLDAPVPRLET